MGTHTLLLLECMNTEQRTEVRVPHGHPACKHGAGPSSRWLVSPCPVSAPREPLPGPVLFRGQDGAVRRVGVTGREGLSDSESVKDKSAQLLWLLTASTYRCPRCLQDASRAPPCRVQSLWGEAGSSWWAVSSSGAPRGKVVRSRGAYCAGSVGPRSRGDRGRGCPGRCPRVDRAHGAGKGSPRARRGLLRVGAEVSSAPAHAAPLPSTGPGAPPPLKPSRHRHWNSYSPAGMHVAPWRQGWRSHGEPS